MFPFGIVTVEGFVAHVVVVAREMVRENGELFHVQVAIYGGVGIKGYAYCAESIVAK